MQYVAALQALLNCTIMQRTPSGPRDHGFGLSAPRYRHGRCNRGRRFMDTVVKIAVGAVFSPWPAPAPRVWGRPNPTPCLPISFPDWHQACRSRGITKRF
jgi:hypothetical protein